MGKLVVLTRPLEDSASLTYELSQKGYTTFIEPLTTIHYLPDVDTRLMPYIASSAILLATSRHAALAPHGSPPHIPWIVSGHGTARVLKSVGCENVTSTGQTAEALKKYLSSRAPDTHPYVYLCGRHKTLDLEATLKPLGYDIHTLEVYEAKALERFSSTFISTLKERSVDTVLFFSSRNAEIFETLVRKEKLEASLADVEAFCLSPQIADSLKLPWKKIHESLKPETPALLALLP